MWTAGDEAPLSGAPSALCLIAPSPGRACTPPPPPPPPPELGAGGLAGPPPGGG
jgi:hypothetical protein